MSGPAVLTICVLAACGDPGPAPSQPDLSAPGQSQCVRNGSGSVCLSGCQCLSQSFDDDVAGLACGDSRGILEVAVSDPCHGGRWVMHRLNLDDRPESDRRIYDWFPGDTGALVFSYEQDYDGSTCLCSDGSSSGTPPERCTFHDLCGAAPPWACVLYGACPVDAGVTD